jgi:hypothetical protein
VVNQHRRTEGPLGAERPMTVEIIALRDEALGRKE